MLPRLQLFEWEDLPWFPAVIRDCATDYLRHVTGVFNMHVPVVSILAPLLRQRGAAQVVDMASGGGGVWPKLAPALVEELAQDGLDFDVTLTDYYPNIVALAWVASLAPNVINYRSTSVNALDVPADLPGVRTQFLSLHHFSPDNVVRILENAVQAGEPIALFEFQKRDWAHIIQFALSPLLVLLMTPMIKPFSWRRLFFTYLVPVVPLLVAWDGVVSALRTYTVAEVEAMIARVDGHETYGWEVQSRKQGLVTVFSAVGWPTLA